MSGWGTIKLGELVSLTGGAPFKSSDFGDCGIPVLKIKNVKANRLLLDDVDHISEDVAKEYPESFLQKGDLLITMTGNRIGGGMDSWVGKVARFNEDRPYCLNQRVGIIRPKSTHALDIRFLSFCLSTGDSQRELIQIATGSGGQANLSPKQILAVKVPHPPLAEQRAIAMVLGLLDDKIELNRRMNETLEALAQSLFKSWFVDATQSALPKGWRETTLDELATISGGKQLPTEECKPSGKFTVFGANGIMGYADRSTHEGFVIAFGRVGAYCGSIHWAHHGAWINNNASSVVPHRWPEFVLQAMLNVNFAAMRTGSAQPFIPNSSLSAAKTIKPTDDILDSYCSIVRPLRLKQTQNEAESRTLAALRDALLPKLLSGELRVKEAYA
jgi:type I restriction enzyme S subunit